MGWSGDRGRLRHTWRQRRGRRCWTRNVRQETRQQERFRRASEVFLEDNLYQAGLPLRTCPLRRRSPIFFLERECRARRTCSTSSIGSWEKACKFGWCDRVRQFLSSNNQRKENSGLAG